MSRSVGLDSPTSSGMVRNTLKGIKWTMGTAAVQKAVALTDDIRAMVAATDAGLIGARDAGGAGETGCCEICGPFSKARTRYQRRDCWSVGAVHHEPDGASERADGEAVYQGWEFVSGE
jgi:hypothetical protein